MPADQNNIKQPIDIQVLRRMGLVPDTHQDFAQLIADQSRAELNEKRDEVQDRIDLFLEQRKERQERMLVEFSIAVAEAGLRTKVRRVYHLCVERKRLDTARKILIKYRFTLMDMLRDPSLLTDWRNLSGVSNQQTQ